MSQEPEGRPDIQEMTARLQSLRGIIESIGEAAREGVRALDICAIAEHPDLDDLNHTLDNLYGRGFD